METGAQLRAARAIVKWTRTELAKSSGVSEQTIKRLESVSGPMVANTRTVAALRQTLEAQGVIFIPGNGGPPGVRFGSQ
jgi:transcriptional regulator with XRE-family HTH domain